MITIIDYGMGNLRSVQKAFEHLGYKAEITNEYKKISKADKLVLPGVGAFADAAEVLRKDGLNEAVYECIERKKPFLGICLGMQLMFEKSFENGEHIGLGLIPGIIKRLPDGVKIPHVGWNSLDIKLREPLFKGIGDEPYVYFVHSYYLETAAPVVSAETFYGRSIQVAAQKDNIFGLQFHPEKSGDTGLKILDNFGGL